MDITVVTPAHNEQDFIGRCIGSVQAAARESGLNVEHVVVLNRCTDRTEQIALDGGCRVVREDARKIGRIRNAGAAAAQGKIIATIDADSWMSENMLSEIKRMLDTGRYVGGGVRVWPERFSIGIFCSVLLLVPYLIWHGVKSAGLFWCYKEDFDAIGGFDESMVAVEDVDFAKRLRRHGRQSGRRYGTIRKAHITTSCRKFDQFGDWYFVRRPNAIYDLFNQDKALADQFYYDVRSDPSNRSDEPG